MKHLSKASYIIIFLFSFMASLALCLNMSSPQLPEQYTTHALLETVWNLKYSLKDSSFTSSLLLVVFSVFGIWIEKRRETRIKSIPVISFLLATGWLIGDFYNRANSLSGMISSAGQAVKCAIYVIGMAFIIYQGFYFLYHIFESKKDIVLPLKQSKIYSFASRHFVLSVFLILILCWLPHILIAFPGYCCSDSWHQIMQSGGVCDITGHHPPIHTLVTGLFVHTGAKLVNGNFGIFLFIIVQTLCAAGTVAYATHTMRKIKAPKWLTVTAVLIGCLVPYFSAHVNVILKDNLFSYAFLLFMTELVNLLVLKKDFFRSIRHILLLGISICGVLMFRNNGQYVIYPFVVILLVYGIYKVLRKKSWTWSHLAKVAAVFILPIVVSVSISSIVTAHYNIQPGSRREALSIVFQQTARYLKDHPEDVTEEEKAAIDAVLDYENLPSLYDPRISDPVKATFNDNATTEELVNYLKVWLKQFFKHPATYVQATLHQNYYIFYPGSETNILYSTTYDSLVDPKVYQMEGFEGYSEEESTILQLTDTGYQNLLFSTPIIGQFSNIAFYNIVLLGICLFVIRKKLYKWFLAFVPIALSIAVVILSPVIAWHPRYAFPIIFSVPLLVAYYIYLKSEHSAQSNAD